jgi:hypothetical protein
MKAWAGVAQSVQRLATSCTLSALSHNGTIVFFKKKGIEPKMRVSNFTTSLYEIFYIVRRTERDV